MGLGEGDWSAPKLGLALGGGVARGWAHIGVLKVFQRAGLVPDVVAGTSIGALVGGCYLAGHLRELEAWTRSLNKIGVVGYLDFSFRRPGLIAGDRLVRAMRQHLGDTRIESLERPFVAVAADMFTGHEVWLKDGDLVDSVRASFAMPGIFPPVIDGIRGLVDGALVNPVPVSVCQALGSTVTIAINLNGDVLGKTRVPGTNVQRVAGFDVDEIAAMTGRGGRVRSGFGLLTRRFFGREKDQPSVFGVMFASLSIILDRITRSRLAGEPPDIQIAPKLGAFGLAEFHRAREMIRVGEVAAVQSLPEIREVMRGCGFPDDRLPRLSQAESPLGPREAPRPSPDIVARIG